MASILLLAYCAGCRTTTFSEHYLGVYDAELQVTQELYKVTVRGTSEWASDVKYASGWVPAQSADLLASQVKFEKAGNIQISGGGQSRSLIPPTHRYFEMGPLGVTQAPGEGRFVIVMSSDPDQFFRKAAALTGFSQERDSDDAMQAARDDVMRKIAQERIAANRQLVGVIRDKKQVEAEPAAK